MARKEKCPACKGKGVVYVSQCDASSKQCITVSRTCKKCKGIGWTYVP